KVAEPAPAPAPPFPQTLQPSSGGGVVLRAGKPPSGLGVLRKFFFRAGNPTDPGMLVTGLIATGVTVLAYLVLFIPLKRTYFGALFADRGWVPYPTVWMFFWAIAIVAVKLYKLAGLHTALVQDPLPDKTSPITPHVAGIYCDHIAKNPKARRNFL